MKPAVGAAALSGAVITGVALLLVGKPAVNGAYDAAYAHAHHPLDQMLAKGDGQAYAAIARDPFLRHPAAIADIAYRISRPVAAYATWAVSLGHPGWVPVAQVIVVIAGAALAAAMVAALIVQRGGNPSWAMWVVLLPGSIVSLLGLTPELLAFGFAAAGVLLLNRDRRWALVFFSLAVLTRETLLLIPLAVAIGLVPRERLRAAAVVAVPFSSWVVWMAVANTRLGLPPLGVHANLHNLAPLGIIHAPLLTLGIVAAIWALSAVALRTWPRDVLTWAMVGYASLTLVLGTSVLRPGDVLRVMVPFAGLALVRFSQRQLVVVA